MTLYLPNGKLTQTPQNWMSTSTSSSSGVLRSKSMTLKSVHFFVSAMAYPLGIFTAFFLV